MTDIVSIIQRVSFGRVDSQALLTWIRWLQKWCFGFCVIVECGNAEFNGTDVTGYRNASSRFTSLPNITSKRLPIFFRNWNCFPNLFRLLQFYVKINLFKLVRKVCVSFYKSSFTNDKCISSPILFTVIKLSTTFFSYAFPVVISLAFPASNGSVP